MFSSNKGNEELELRTQMKGEHNLGVQRIKIRTE